LAKLENVKVIDMVNGEPTRVEYNGEIYEKAKGIAKSGDLVRVADDVYITDVTEGGFYEIYADEHGDLAFDDDIGDARDYDVWTDELETFRKVPAQPQHDLAERIAELERRIAALEGRGNGEVAEDQPKYRKVTDRDPRVGDYVKFDEAPRSYLTAGKYYEIVEIDVLGDPQIIDDDGDELDIGGFEFEVYEMVAEGAPKFEVGDYAKVLAKGFWRDIEVGSIVKIVGQKDDDGDYKVELLDGSDYDYFNDEQLEKITEEEANEFVKWAKIGRKPGEFKNGDIVRVIDTQSSYIKNGEIGILGENDDYGAYRVFVRDVKTGNWHSPKHLELICPVEHRFDREGVNA
jgi:hypothetical protein